MDTNEYHSKARFLIRWCAIIGAIVAFLLFPIPCVSWPVLMAIEVYMLINILKIYNYELDTKIYIMIFM